MILLICFRFNYGSIRDTADKNDYVQISLSASIDNIVGV